MHWKRTKIVLRKKCEQRRARCIKENKSCAAGCWTGVDLTRSCPGMEESAAQFRKWFQTYKHEVSSEILSQNVAANGESCFGSELNWLWKKLWTEKVHLKLAALEETKSCAVELARIGWRLTRAVNSTRLSRRRLLQVKKAIRQFETPFCPERGELLPIGCPSKESRPADFLFMWSRSSIASLGKIDERAELEISPTKITPYSFHWTARFETISRISVYSAWNPPADFSAD